MATNVTPQYRKAEERYRKAIDPVEKLSALEEMFKELPKHKASEKLQADLKTKISNAKKEVEAFRAKGAAAAKKTGVSHHVETGGFPQIVAIGAPNAGKSRVLSILTGAELEVADYPYTTRVPRPAMMPWEDVQVQMVDTPPIATEFMEPWMSSIVRVADEVLLVVDVVAPDLLESTEGILSQLAAKHTLLHPAPEAEEDVGIAVLPTIVAANKMDLDGAADGLLIFRELYESKFEIVPMSCETLEGIEALRLRLYQVLDRVRVYAKRPGKPPDHASPYLLTRGSTVVDFAERIHRDLAKNFKRARIWGSKEYPDGQWIPRDYVVGDRDIIEVEV